MTRIDFHTHLGNETQWLNYAARLVLKIYRTQHPLIVIGDLHALKTFDAYLWTFSPLEFIPHCMYDHALSKDTNIILTPLNTDIFLSDLMQYNVLNLGLDVPTHFARAQRLFELVNSDENTLIAARKRYLFYQKRGYILNHHRPSHELSRLY